MAWTSVSKFLQVVPVENETFDKWTFPPFSGHVDSDYIWGRGAEDDKSNLIAILSAFEALLALNFRPNRTIIMAIGFDEEGGAEEAYGAKGLSEFLLSKYGTDSMELIVGLDILPVDQHPDLDQYSSMKESVVLRAILGLSSPCQQLRRKAT